MFSKPIFKRVSMLVLLDVALVNFLLNELYADDDQIRRQK